MSGQFAPESKWSVCSGKQPGSTLFRGGQFVPESGGQFDRILQLMGRIPDDLNGFLCIGSDLEVPGAQVGQLAYLLA